MAGAGQRPAGVDCGVVDYGCPACAGQPPHGTATRVRPFIYPTTSAPCHRCTRGGSMHLARHSLAYTITASVLPYYHRRAHDPVPTSSTAALLPQVYTWRRQLSDRNTLFRAWDDWPTLGKRETSPGFPLPHTLHLLATGGLAGSSSGWAGVGGRGHGCGRLEGWIWS